MESVKHLLGNFGDNTWLIWEGLRLKYGLFDESYYGIYGFYNNNFILEPVLYYPYLFFSKFINAIDLWGIFVLLLLSINLYFSYKYFYLQKNNSLLSFIFSLLWISNSYFSIHSRDHLSLLSAFLFPIFFLYINQKDNNFKTIIIRYVFLGLSILTSIYIGIFLAITNCFWSVYKFVKNKDLFTKTELTLSFTFIFSLYVLIKVFFPGTARDIDNFRLFSSKPWHYVIQSPRSFINYTDLETLLPKNNILYNYFDSEHSVSYFSISLSFLFLYLLFKGKIRQDINLYFLFFLLILSFPPVVTFKGINFYLPSYILYELFPQLRVLSRINILTNLVFLGLILKYLNWESITKFKKYLYYFLFLFAFTELYVPLKISTLENNTVFEYIKNNTSMSSQLIFYPYEITDYGIKYMIFHQRKVINPRGYEKDDFNTKDFTNNLNCGEIKKYKNINYDNLYLVSKKMNVENGMTNLNSNLELVTYDENLILYKVKCE